MIHGKMVRLSLATCWKFSGITRYVHTRKLYTKICHGQFGPCPLQFMMHIQSAITHTINLKTFTRPNVYHYFVLSTVSIHRSCSELMGELSCIHAQLSPVIYIMQTLITTPELSNLKVQQMKTKQTMPNPRTSLGPQCVIAAVHREAETALPSSRIRFYSRQQVLSQQWFSMLFSIPPVSVVTRQSKNSSRNNQCQPTGRNTM